MRTKFPAELRFLLRQSVESAASPFLAFSTDIIEGERYSEISQVGFVEGNVSW